MVADDGSQGKPGASSREPPEAFRHPRAFRHPGFQTTTFFEAFRLSDTHVLRRLAAVDRTIALLEAKGTAKVAAADL
jgi:hypothetical protein